jgi:exoribonuclease-2
MNTLYRYRVEDLPELLHMCQELVEKYRDQVQIAWGAHIDHHPRDYHKHHYHHALLANFLFGQVPKPHEYYIAQRLLVESTRYFTPTADPLYFSVNSPQHVQNFNKPRVSEVTEPAPNVKNVEPETVAEVSHDSARLDDVEGTRQFVRRLVKRLQHKYPRARDHDAQRARDQSVVVSEEWNPVADKALIDELKTWALNNSSVNERLISAENSRPVRHTTMMVHERLIEPLCRGLGIGTTPRDIFDVLTSLGVWHKHENLNLHRYPYKWQFSAQELLHYAHLSTLFGPSVTRDSSASQVCVDKDHAVRVDMRQQCPVVVSVDNSTEQLEVDDAVSLEHVTGTDRPWIWVHIADPSRCVTPNSAVDLLARERVSSIYLPERARDPITMFPAPLVSSNFNLLHDHTNYALSFGIRLQEDGQVDEYVIVPSIVPPVHKRTYALVDDWLHEDWVPRDSEQTMLHELYALSQRRRAYRARCGALASMELPRAEISVRENGEQIEISMVPEHDSKSRALISELMILVGDITADFAKRHDIPIPYRSPVPDQPSKYTYCVRPPTTPHSALALPLYTQVTSPIRRYHDLLVHHQIKAHLRGEELPFTEERVAAILHEMEPVLREITKLNQYSTRYWMLRYLEQQPQHRKYIGRVLSINTAASDSEVSVYVYMLEVGLRANVMLDWRPKVHQHLTLRVNSVDAFYNLIHLSEVPSNCE